MGCSNDGPGSPCGPTSPVSPFSPLGPCGPVPIAILPVNVPSSLIINLLPPLKL